MVPVPASCQRLADGTFVDVLKVGVIVLIVLIVLLGLLGMPMSGGSMCPDCGLGTSSSVCIALLASVVLLIARRAMGLLLVRGRRPLLMTTDPLEPPPRLS